MMAVPDQEKEKKLEEKREMETASQAEEGGSFLAAPAMREKESALKKTY